jgi:hypothetical protein
VLPDLPLETPDLDPKSGGERGDLGVVGRTARRELARRIGVVGPRHNI